MTDHEELQTVMQSLGFTKYEITIMIKLYNQGSSKADELKGENVPLSRVYDALDLLVRKGFVQSSQGRPKIFTAVKPQEAVSSLIDLETQKFKETIDSYSQQASSFLDHAQILYYKTHTEVVPDDLLTQYGTLSEAEDKTKKIIIAAQEEIIIFTHVFNWFESIEQEIGDALTRGCKIRVLLQGKQKKGIVNRLKKMGICVKVIPEIKMLSRGTIVDNQSVLFIIWINNNPVVDRMIHRPQFSINRGIVEVFKMSFEYLWMQ